MVVKYLGMSRRVFWALVLAGVVLRLVASTRGHNFDIESYAVVGDIVTSGGDVYLETSRYNYGPVWFLVVGALYGLSDVLNVGFDGFRYLVAGFLACVDVAICLLLARRFGSRVALLFFLNPISILITGYHSQFDNLAVLCALIAVFWVEDHERSRSGIVLTSLALGTSLVVKHIALAFPLWLAATPRKAWARLALLGGPLIVLALAFVPVLNQWRGIEENVIGYRSYDNAPLLRLLLPDEVVTRVVAYAFFAIVIAGGAFILRHRKPTEQLAFYLFAIVVAAPALANQYLAIPLIGMAMFPNVAFAAYSLFGGVFLMLDPDGLHLVGSLVDEIIAQRTMLYGLLAGLLGAGTVLAFRAGRSSERRSVTSG